MSTMQRTQLGSLSGAQRRGVLALGAIIIAAVLVLWIAWPLVSLLARGSSDSSREGATRQAQRERFQTALAGHRAQFDGRSIFFTPLAPPPPPPPPVAERPKVDPGPPPPPSSYGGPVIMAMINDAVWFTDGKRAILDGPEVNGVKVVDLTPPWSARLRWKGAEFDVELFKRDQVVVPASLKGAPRADADVDADPPEPDDRDVADEDIEVRRTDADKDKPAEPQPPASAPGEAPTTTEKP
jgi:hypothetical protein